MEDIILWCIFLLLITFIITLWIALLYSGILTGVTVKAGKPPISSVKIMYKYSMGPYKNVGSYFTELVSLAPDNRSFGVYYDDPDKVEAEKLRWIVATILAEGEETDPTQYEDLEKKLRKEGWKSASFPKVNHAVTTTFPFATTLSIYISVAKVYPKLKKFIEENKLSAHPCLEIYDKDTIHFMAPLAMQNSFYVPECSPPQATTENTQLEEKDEKQSEEGSSSGASSFEELDVNED